MTSEVEKQRAYYAETASDYDDAHVGAHGEHETSILVFASLGARFGEPSSVLDVGAGTGRAIRRLKRLWPQARIVGIEPIRQLRDVAYQQGVAADELLDGDATRLAFSDNSFDWVIETGALHHIRNPGQAVAEMVRVARRGVMISDSNNIGQGGSLARLAKYLLKGSGLWPVAIWLQTGGKMYKESDGDGIYYSFTVFDQLRAVTKKFPEVHYLNTGAMAGYDLRRGAGHVMVLAYRL
ncbi:MAG TPA: class I SAM-dependent methyltransferase [Caulobacteraceae bacterium]